MQILQFYFILAVFATLSIIYLVSPVPHVIVQTESGRSPCPYACIGSGEKSFLGQ